MRVRALLLAALIAGLVGAATGPPPAVHGLIHDDVGSEIAGQRGPHKVTRLWVHHDTLVDLEIAGAIVTTTEDHPFWNETDRRWERADALDPGDFVLSDDGEVLTVGRWGSDVRSATAYNLTVDGVHTYFVSAGANPVLVHNTCLPGPGDIPARVVNSNMGHAAEQAVNRLGFENVRSARSALQDLGQTIQSKGFPAGTIADTNPGRLLVPFGDGGYAVYQIAKNGNAVLKTVLIAK